MKINLLHTNEDREDKDNELIQKPLSLWHFVFLLVLPIAIIGTVFFWSPRLQKNARAVESLPNKTAWNKIKSFVASIPLPGSDDRINFLILGKGGANHEGPNLTDTIIIASTKPSSGETALLSIPRDLYVYQDTWGWRKINHAYALAEAEKPGNGALVASKILKDVFGVPLHYYIVVDFDGFRDLIDALSGVPVYVERAFNDSGFPGVDFTTRVVSFDQGLQKMNGQRALEFARSRHGTNGESTDFARARRQQKIIIAVKDQILSSKTLANPRILIDTLAALRKYVQTNIGFNDIAKIAKLTAQFDETKIKNIVLEDGPSGLLEAATTDDGQYILQPKDGDWNILKKIARNIFEYEKVAAKYITVPARIELQNGTEHIGLAATFASTIKSDILVVMRTANAPSRGFKKTVLYDKTDGEKNKQLEKLRTFLPADTVITKEKISDSSADIDFVVILGEDAVK